MERREITAVKFTQASPPRRWWQGWYVTWTPWPMIGAAALGLNTASALMPNCHFRWGPNCS